MKKLFIATGLALTIALASFASPFYPSGIDAKILNNFAAKFLSAENVQWAVTVNYTEATFTWQNQQMNVFYGTDGDLIAVSRKINYENLPVNALLAIQEKYGDYAKGETIEMNSTEDGLSYYISLTNSEKRIILKSSPLGELRVFKKENI